MRSVLKSLQRDVARHQVAVKAMKEKQVLNKATLLKCGTLSKKAIPEIHFFPQSFQLNILFSWCELQNKFDILNCWDFLDLLESNPSPKNQWKFHGHFSAFMALIYGQRGGVYQNMIIEEVAGAWKSTSEKSYLINFNVWLFLNVLGACICVWFLFLTALCFLCVIRSRVSKLTKCSGQPRLRFLNMSGHKDSWELRTNCWVGRMPSIFSSHQSQIHARTWIITFRRHGSPWSCLTFTDIWSSIASHISVFSRENVSVSIPLCVILQICLFFSHSSLCF